MAKKQPPSIDEIIKNKWLVEFIRKPLDKDKLYGFILACSDEFSLLHILDDGMFMLNGYTVIRNKDIKKYLVYDDKESFLSKYINLKKIKPKPLPDFSIESLKDILLSISKQFPLITIHLEEIDNQVCYIGKLKEIGKKKFSLYEIDSDAAWIGDKKYKYKDVTKIDFDGCYEKGLSLVAESDAKKSREEL